VHPRGPLAGRLGLYTRRSRTGAGLPEAAAAASRSRGDPPVRCAEDDSRQRQGVLWAMRNWRQTPRLASLVLVALVLGCAGPQGQTTSQQAGSGEQARQNRTLLLAHRYEPNTL